MTPHSSPGFIVFHSNRMEGLRELLLHYVKERPLPPLASETILVQSNGMKHWLTLALADDAALGVCAATRMELPSSALWQIYRAVLGADQLPARMPLDKAPLVWRILRRLPVWLSDPRFALLAHYLQDDTQGTRAFGLAQQLADVLDGYQNYRVDWLQDWAQGHDRLGPQRPLTPDQTWQAQMWRDLLADVQAGLPAQHSEFVARSDVHLAFLQALKTWPAKQPILGLPPRLLVFGVTALPMQTLQAMVALGQFIPVLMFVHNPSQEHWGHLTESWVPQGHPLLASWGKHGRDYLHALQEFDAKEVQVFIDPVKEAQDTHQAPSALQQLQSAVLHMAEPPAQPSELGAADDSILFVQTHSAQREVEVLHDRLLAWLDADPGLQASDIMVMVPDMAVFAPHIHAVFSRQLPYAVADNTSHADPLVQALHSLLQLPQLRWSLNDWLGLFQVQAVRERFGLSTNEVSQLHDWLAAAGVRWGLDATHRQAWGMSSHLLDASQNTWAFGLQRLLLGYAQGGHSEVPPIWHNRLGQAGVDGLDAPVISGLLRCLQAMNQSLEDLSQMHTPTEWVQQLQTLVERFFKATDDNTQGLLERVLAPLEDWLSDCQSAQFDAPLALSVVRSHWLAQMDASSLQRRFIGGGVQFATLMPMRAIPFKVVCLLGMNDGAYPRAPTPRNFDLMSQAGLGRAGDRARREDDRYLFLEAVLSARQCLYVSWQGRRASDHAVLPASVLVGQLMDHLNQCHQRQGSSGAAFEARLQPLQAFSSRYFDAASGFFTYDKNWATALATAAQLKLQPAAQPSEQPLAKAPERADNSALKLLLRRPQEVYFLHHLQARLNLPPTAQSDDEPFAPDGLTYFILQQELFNSAQPQATLTQWKLQGRLALGAMGELQQAQMLQLRETLLKNLKPWLTPQDGTVLHINLRPGQVMTKKKPSLYTLTDLWVDHLSALAAGEPSRRLQCGSDALLSLSYLPALQAQTLLNDLQEVYAQAWAQPLPLACKTACAWLRTQAYAPEKNSPAQTAQQAQAAARVAFEGGYAMGEMQQSPYLQRAFEHFDDVWPAMQTWAERVYGPLLQAVRVESVWDTEDAEETEP